MRALNETGYTTPTPIQAKAIPPLLAGRDLLGLAETGTGKTAAFTLPLLQRLAAEGVRAAPRCTRALILAPTRELAIQIGESIATYGRHMGLRHTVIFGGVGQRPQVKAVERGVDIVVATPGRLLDLIDQKCLRLDQVVHFVLDEADRMFDMGFIRDVRKIVRMVPKVRQTLLFSATMPADIAALAAEVLHNPERVEITHTGKTVDRIDQRVHFIAASQKKDLLNTLLADPAFARVIIFTRTKRGADRVSRNLEQAKINSFSIHGNKSQGARQHALESFRAGGTRVLVATDIAARGIDIDDVTHVINYELPNIPESYVHRIGRTARAGSDGIAIAFCAPDERPYLRDIERLTRIQLKVQPAIAMLAGSTASADDDGEAARDDSATGFVPKSGPTFHDQKRARQRKEAETGQVRGPRAEDTQRRAAADDRRPSRGDRNDRGPRPTRGGDDRPRSSAGPRSEAHSDKPWSNRPDSRGDRDRPRTGDRDRGASATADRKPWVARPDGARAPDRRPEGGRPASDRPAGERPFQSRGFKSNGTDTTRPENQRSRGVHDRPAGDRDRPRPAGGDRDRNRDSRPDQRGERPQHAGAPRSDHRDGGRPANADRGPRRDGNGPSGGKPAWAGRADAPRGPSTGNAPRPRPRADGDTRRDGERRGSDRPAGDRAGRAEPSRRS